MLFFELASILTHVISLRTALSLHTISPDHPIRLALFIILIIKLVLFTALFNIELLGPDGWDGMTWRSWLSFLPFVADEGKIRLESEEGGAEREWDQKPCPRLRANIFEVLTFSWMTPMMKAGYSKYLTEEDLWSLPPDDTAEALGSTLEKHWVKRKEAVKARAKPGHKEERPNLTAALAASFGGPFFVAAIFKVSSGDRRRETKLTISMIVPSRLSRLHPASAPSQVSPVSNHWYDVDLTRSLCSRLLIWVGTYRSANPEPAFHGYIIAFSMFGCAIIQTLLLHCYFARVFETGMRVRAGLVSLIYKKSLVLSNDERGGRLTGDIVNLQSTDSTRLQVSPLSICAGMGLTKVDRISARMDKSRGLVSSRLLSLSSRSTSYWDGRCSWELES